ncbi:MAG: transposase [Verrucomicrobia bacterium]|nr:transposase [Verrucomicrobiota bacterium]
MELWKMWFEAVTQLRPACIRQRTFCWMVICLLGLCIRTELAGVTSFVRALGLDPFLYKRLLHLFHSPALKLDTLTEVWTRWCADSLPACTVGAYRVWITDGIKAPKEGRKMPAVKKLHQESANNSKPEFIFGHSFQCISLLIQTAQGFVAAVPLAARICEGVVWSNRDKRTQLDRVVTLFLSLTDALGLPVVLVADAYYATRKVILPLLAAGHHLVTRARKNAVAYELAPRPKQSRRGRPRLYGKRIRLRDLFCAAGTFTSVPSPVYDDKNVVLEFRCIDLLWRPVGRLVRFVLVRHPHRGSMILMASDITMDPLDIIILYGYRFKIEVGFRQALHVVGAYAYHFWMAAMIPIRRVSGNQYMHHNSDRYRQMVRRKLAAYHNYVQLGCIAQGLLQYLAITARPTVWKLFHSWLRTMRTELPPSELVVAHALRDSLPEFLAVGPGDRILAEFLRQKVLTRSDSYDKSHHARAA